jgi:hypothetical protein
MNYKIVAVRGHYEVYINGKFYCSADTPEEAVRDIEDYRDMSRTA